MKKLLVLGLFVIPVLAGCRNLKCYDVGEKETISFNRAPFSKVRYSDAFSYSAKGYDYIVFSGVSLMEGNELNVPMSEAIAVVVDESLLPGTAVISGGQVTKTTVQADSSSCSNCAYHYSSLRGNLVILVSSKTAANLWKNSLQKARMKLLAITGSIVTPQIVAPPTP